MSDVGNTTYTTAVTVTNRFLLRIEAGTRTKRLNNSA